MAEEPTAQQKAIGCLVLIVFVVAVGYLLSGDGDSGGSSSSESVSLSASIRFTGTQFVIENGDDFDWTGVEFDLNGGVFSSGYVLRADRIEAGQTYTVGALQFAKSDGTRFNPVTMKPVSFQITADTPQGRGFYVGNWK
jgi:hypothetical protein